MPNNPIGLLFAASRVSILCAMVKQITSLPSAPSRFAFFDVDGTLLPFKSMFDFQSYIARQTRGSNARLRYLARRLRFGFYEIARRNRLFVNRKYYETFRGQRVAEVCQRAEEWFACRKAEGKPLFIAPMIDVLETHRRDGFGIVLVSGSFNEILAPVARELRATAVLSTRLEAVDGIYTGRILPPQMIGHGKSDAIRAFLLDRGIDPESCSAFGDHWSDLAMLRAVGGPGVVAGDPRLETYAQSMGWPVIANTWSVRSHLRKAEMEVGSVMERTVVYLVGDKFRQFCDINPGVVTLSDFEENKGDGGIKF